MKIERQTYEHVECLYTLEIDDAFVEKLNKSLKKLVGEEGCPVVSKNTVAAVYRKDDIPELDFVVERYPWGDVTLADFIQDFIGEYIWDTEDVEILDREVVEYDDDVVFDTEEEEVYDNFVQMSIFDEEKDNEN